MGVFSVQGATGYRNIDGLLAGSKWTGTISFSFPDSSSDYGNAANYPRPSFVENMSAVDALQKQAALNAFNLISSFTNATFINNGSNPADIQISKTAGSLLSTGLAFIPSADPSGSGGDVWFGAAMNSAPALPGTYGYMGVLHEIGHALGLKDPHLAEGPAGLRLSSGIDALEFSVMSYRSFQNSPLSGYTNGPIDFPTTFMIADIRALQELYGANYNTQSGDTVYSWNPSTGAMSINGVSQGAPAGNRVFMTVWDGGGTDTYDLSAYSGGMWVDLRPGWMSTISKEQLARFSGNEYGYVQGNVYNASMVFGDTRSLIENAIGGSGADWMVGNQAANRLNGGAGFDTLVGFEGADTLIGGAGSDTYILSDLSDQVVEDANGGLDTVQIVFASSAGSYTLGANVEMGVLGDWAFNLRLGKPPATPEGSETGNDVKVFTLNGNALSNRLTGDSAANILNGGEGADTLEGGGGADTLSGGAGDDVYIVANALALILESSGQGTDTIILEATAGADPGKPLSYALPSWIENGSVGGRFATGTGTSNLVGNDLANRLNGNRDSNLLHGGSGADTLFGEGGADTLSGGAGADRLNGGDGNDVFLFDVQPLGSSAGADTILDFQVGSDKIYISRSAFVGLSQFGDGALSGSLFWSGANATAARDSDDRFAYNTTTGILYYDSDGVGGAAAVAIATFTGSARLTLSAADFVLVA